MKNKLCIGDEVKSHYRATWKGTVIQDITNTYNNHPSQVLVVLVHTSRRDTPVRKPFKNTLCSGWLTKIQD